MIEETVRNYLDDTLPDVTVLLEVPLQPPAEYVLIERTGGGYSDGISSAMVTVQSYGASLYRAAELNERVKSAMLAMPDTQDVYSVKLNSDYNYTSTKTKQHRYQAVFDINY